MSQFFTPRNILRMLWRRSLIIGLILAIGLPLSVWFALKQPRLYEAIAVIQIEASEIADPLSRTGTTPAADGQLELIQQKLMSRDHMTAVIERLGLFDADITIIEKVGMLRGAVSIVKLIDPAQAFRPDVRASGLIITVRLGDAEEAANVANDFLTAILAEAQARADGRATRTLEFFTGEEARINAEILAAEAELSGFKEANAAALPEVISSQRDRMSSLHESGIILDQQLIELETDSERLREGDVARQRELLAQQRALINTNIAQIEAAIANAPEVERQLSALNRRLEQLTSEFTVITTNRTEAAMTQLIESQDQASRFEVLETAIEPEYPISASRRKIAMAGAVAASIVAFGVAFLIEFSNPVIRNAAQLQAQLGLQPVVTIPHLQSRVQRRRRKAGLLALLLALLAGLFGVAWWFKDRLVELIGWVPWARMAGGARGAIGLRVPTRG